VVGAQGRYTSKQRTVQNEGVATFTYRPSKAKQLEYLITADRYGGYTVSLNGKIVAQMHAGEGPGRSRLSGRHTLDQGIEAAKALIESMHSGEA